jgi:trk system potassium uptake protein
MPTKSSSAPTLLTYSIRPRVVFKYLGQLFTISGFLACAPLIVSIAFKEFGISQGYLIVIALFFALGFLSKTIAPPKEVQFNESYVIVGLAFLLSSFALLIPMSFTGIPIMDAWFEIVSGITTTGLSTIPILTDKAQTFLFVRSWMQWYGGLGIVVLSLGLAMQPGNVAKMLSITFTDREEIVGNTRSHGRRMFFIYGTLTLLCFITLIVCQIPFFPSVILCLSSVSTGGFSPFSDSLASFTPIQQSAVQIFSFLGAISFPLYWITGPKFIKALFANVQFWGLLTAALLMSLLLYLLNGEISPLNALLTGFSAQSTTGFAVGNIAAMTSGSKLLLIGSMLIGGSTLSTAGGFKIFRLLILLKAFHRIFFRTSLSRHAVFNHTLGKYKLDSEERENCFTIIFFFLTALFLSWFCFLLYGYAPLDSLFEVASALGTVGLSTGITSETLPSFLKIVLCMDMFLGRLEFVTFLVLFYPRTFIGRRLKQ